MASEADRVRNLVTPIVDDLSLDLYDIERRGNTLRITVDTPPGSESGVSLDSLSLVTRLVSRELDHEDPIHGTYTLEVTSPGLERPLRTAAHFQREIGKDITVRLTGPAVSEGEERRVEGKLVAADDHTATVLTAAGDERVIDIAGIDKARTIFEWGPKPKPGKGPSKTPAKAPGHKEKQQS